MTSDPNILLWIIGSGIAMSCIAFVGSAIFLFSGEMLAKILLPLVAFSAGALIGGALFHLIPASLEAGSDTGATFLWVAAGFTVFFALEQFLHWHHCERADTDCRKPLTYLILIGDGLHNFIGGLAIAGTFMLDVRLGIAAWFAAAAHELPQELGDMGVLLYGGWSKMKATLFNFVSALTFLAGGLIAYWLSYGYEIWFLIPFAAGNFLYIGASDLIPEINRHEKLSVNLVHFLAFSGGMFLLYFIG